ncbi:uncharacterized protein KY384_006778 [Bacidia gigantensis]|uniref:uncharacterized protein n=1 Tax=Bacidia gigantensis TaxID=2732470 RepID=UPI001D058440|nr:uncharacterized protein KY384_006778 [Bacidia gigantensis]KAG8527862.1 hypothetical protein KY384_006778 [Bacidia gigantensis]
MDSLLAPLSGSTQMVDEASRLKLQDSLRSAADAMETPHDTMLRLFNTSLEISVVRAGCDLNLFTTLSESQAPISVEKFSTEKGAEPLLIGRLLRYLASRRLIAETGKDEFTANNATKALADPRINGAMYYTHNIGGPVYQAMPDHLKAQQYHSNPQKFAWHAGLQTDQDFFPWAKEHPKEITWFQQLMSVPREGDWLDVAPFDNVTAGPDQAFFVDVGGSIGHQCARLRTKRPELAGKIILEDLEETIASAKAIDGVEFKSHNFFEPQPVKGAKFYYLRTVLHDWDDVKSEEILKQIIPAMGPDSKILIDEMALPNQGVHWWSACLDLHMYAMLGALERTVEQWHELLEGRCGLKIEAVKTYMPTMRNSVIVCGLKQ